MVKPSSYGRGPWQPEFQQNWSSNGYCARQSSSGASVSPWPWSPWHGWQCSQYSWAPSSAWVGAGTVGGAASRSGVGVASCATVWLLVKKRKARRETAVAPPKIKRFIIWQNQKMSEPHLRPAHPITELPNYSITLYAISDPRCRAAHLQSSSSPAHTAAGQHPGREQCTNVYPVSKSSHAQS